ncbi:MAG: stage III sporulation protein AG [Clostridium sp.]
MKFREYIKKIYNDPKKFITNVVVFLVLGVLLMLAGKTGFGILGINSDKSNVNKPKKEIVAQQGDEIQVASNTENFLGNKDYEEKLKRDIADTLVQINGVGKVSVMIYFEGSSESVPAVNSIDSNKKTEEKDKEGGTRTISEINKNSTVVITGESGRNKALIVKETRPVIGGVMIVAQGALDSAIKEEVTSAVKTLLNIPINKVFVSPMKKS